MRNYIIPKIIKRLEILYKEKEYLYPLVIILGKPVLYKNGIINLEIRLIQINIKGYSIMVNFNILLLG